MFLTHTNSVYSEDTVLLEHIPHPQYVHAIGDPNPVKITTGLDIMPGQLIDYVLRGKYGAEEGTIEHIQYLLSLARCKVGFILAAGNTCWTGYLTSVKRTAKYPVYNIPPMGVSQVYAGYIANKLGNFEYIATDSTSCISGHSAWYTARNMISLKLLDAVVVVSVDNGLSEEHLSIFGGNKLSKLKDEENSSDITKFRLGQGCNISIFESIRTLKYSIKEAPNPSILANIKDIYITAEHHHSPLGISPTGAGYTKVIESVDTSNIDFIKTHSTFSDDNKIEEKLITSKFGNIRLVNYKLRIGHTMGASTAIETALAVKEETGIFLSLGAGMGNVFSAAVVEIL